ncbi:MAG: hypothetical protein PHI18_04735 [bacterium]|nr:hypothetical protein [bacterium]
MRFNLGDTVEDKITRYRGIVTAWMETITDRKSYLVEEVDALQSPIEWWFDEGRLTLIESARHA